MIRILMKMRIAGLMLVFLLPFIVSAQDVEAPLDHPVYDFLNRMKIKHPDLSIRNQWPLSRIETARILADIDSIRRTAPDEFSSIEIAFLSRYQTEFYANTGRSIKGTPGQKEPHLYAWQTGESFGSFDFVVGGKADYRSNGAEKSEREVIAPYYGGILRGSIYGIGFYSDNRIYAEWGSRHYEGHYNPSRGYPFGTNEDGSRAIWDVSESYIQFNIKEIGVQFGRAPLRWGPARHPLFISDNSPAFDLFKLNVPVGNVLFSWFHGELRSSFSHKWIAAHRIDIPFSPVFQIGIEESVIYGDRDIELAYLNPVMPYLIAEHTLGDKDNVAIGLDFDWKYRKAHRFYGEFFIDDLFSPADIFSDFWGNKLAFTFGHEMFLPGFLNQTRLIAEYTRIEPYVYTHHIPVNVYENYNEGLGHFMQPNSDLWAFETETWLSPAWKTGLLFTRQRHGEGDRRTPHEDEEGEVKRFLNGIVQEELQFAWNLTWEPFRDIFVSVRLSRVDVQNNLQVEGNDRSWNQLSLEGHLNW